MHSPFGALYPIIEKTGWTIHRIMWKESWIKLQLIIADAPGVKMMNKKEPEVKKGSKETLLARYGNN